MLQGITGLHVDPGKWAPWWDRELKVQTQGGRWMDVECCSRIYCLWHALPVMGVRKWALTHDHPLKAQLLEQTGKWLHAFWTFVALGAQPKPPLNIWSPKDKPWRGLAVTATGDRSFSRKGGKPPVHIDRHHLCWVAKRAIYSPSAAGTSLPSGWKARWNWDVIQAIEKGIEWSAPYGLTETERVGLKTVINTGNHADAVTSWLCGTVSQFTIIRTAKGSATIMLQAKNSATAPLYAMTATQQGNACKKAGLSADSGRRSGISQGSAWLEEGRIFAKRGDGTVEKGHIPKTGDSIPLPPGNRLYTITLNSKGAICKNH